MSYDIPEGANEAVGSLGAVVLPFAAPIVYWRNGDEAFARVKDIQDARRFGGWGIQPDELDAMKESLPPELPADWQEFEFSGKEGVYMNYITRKVYAAIIARRFAWFANEGSSKSVTQYLAYLGTRVENNIMPWGPVILQAKSLGGVDLDKAIANFKKLTAQFRDNTKESFFYAPLGSWGDEPVSAFNKSKNGNKQSYVTPVRVYQPQGGYSKTLVDMLFVGRETAAEIVQIRKQSQEWLDDWNNRRKVAEVKPPEANPFGDADFGAAPEEEYLP